MLDTVQDFLVDWPGWASLSPVWGDETSNLANGVTLVKELRPQLWQLDAETVTLEPTDLAFWRTKLLGLQNGKRLFYGFDKTNFYPLHYPNGFWPTGDSFSGNTAQIHSITDRYNIALDHLPKGYIGTVGDFLSIVFSGSLISLHRVVESFVSDDDGVTATFSIEPYLRIGVAPGAVVSVKKPGCNMMVVPGSVVYPGAAIRGSLSFKGLQVP